MEGSNLSCHSLVKKRYIDARELVQVTVDIDYEI